MGTNLKKKIYLRRRSLTWRFKMSQIQPVSFSQVPVPKNKQALFYLVKQRYLLMLMKCNQTELISSLSVTISKPLSNRTLELCLLVKHIALITFNT